VNILRTDKLTDLSHLNLYRTRYEDRNGDSKNWVFASRQDPPRLLSGAWQEPDAVVIVPYHVARQKLVVIEEFRVVLGGYQYGFPAGLVDPGETVEDTCGRELFEETGLSLARVLRQSPPVYSSSGMTDESVSIVYVECDGMPSNAANESSEDIRTVLVDREAAADLCMGTDRRIDVKTWLVLSHYARFGTV